MGWTEGEEGEREKGGGEEEEKSQGELRCQRKTEFHLLLMLRWAASFLFTQSISGKSELLIPLVTLLHTFALPKAAGLNERGTSEQTRFLLVISPFFSPLLKGNNRIRGWFLQKLTSGMSRPAPATAGESEQDLGPLSQGPFSPPSPK